MEALGAAAFHRRSARTLGARAARCSDAAMRARVLFAVLLAGPGLPAQERSAAELRAAAHAAVARALAADERASRSEALLADAPGAAALLLAARGELDPALRRWRLDHAAYRRVFAKAAVRTLRERRGKDGEQRIATLREECLAVSRGEELSKESIHDVIDPRLAQLEQLFVVDAAAVRDADPSIEAEALRLRAEAELLVEWYLIAERCEAVLLATPNGTRFLRAHALAEDPRGFAEELDEDEATLAAAATPIEARDQKVLQRNAALAAELDPEEYAGLVRLNVIRLRLGLNALAIDPKLCAAARDHSHDMATLGFFAHESPVEGKRSPGDRAARFGSSAGAENIAAGQSTGLGAIEAWWYSPGHHRNLLSGSARVGLGRHEHHWTQMFGG